MPRKHKHEHYVEEGVEDVIGSHKDIVLHLHVPVLIHVPLVDLYQEQPVIHPVVTERQPLVHVLGIVHLADHYLDPCVIRKVVMEHLQHVPIHVPLVDHSLDQLVHVHKELHSITLVRQEDLYQVLHVPFLQQELHSMDVSMEVV